MIMSKIIMMNKETAIVKMKINNTEWTIDITDRQKCLEPHQVEYIKEMVEHAIEQMFSQNVKFKYDSATIHDDYCEYTFNFYSKLKTVDVILR